MLSGVNSAVSDDVGYPISSDSAAVKRDILCGPRTLAVDWQQYSVVRIACVTTPTFTDAKPDRTAILLQADCGELYSHVSCESVNE